jgi:hypothetical protein
MKSPAIGIDLGTTYSCVGVWQHGKVEIIANDQGNRTTPSYVAFTDTERLLGDAAKNQVAMNPSNTVFDAKRLIGRKYDDPKIQQDLKHWPFKVISDGGKPKIQVDYKGEIKKFAPEEISSMVLTKMKETAEAYLLGNFGQRCGHHRSGILQRLSKTSYEGRRRHRWFERDEDHQRTDGGSSSLRSGQESEGREKRVDLRSRRRHFRRLHFDHRRRVALRSESHGGRHALGR